MTQAQATPATATTAEPAAVQLIGVHKWFGEFRALNDVNLEVRRGERIVVCGDRKSTRLNSSHQ